MDWGRFLKNRPTSGGYYDTPLCGHLVKMARNFDMTGSIFDHEIWFFLVMVKKVKKESGGHFGKQ